MLAHRELIGRLDREIYLIQPVISNGDSNEDKITDWELIENDSFLNARKVDLAGSTTVINDRLTYIQPTEWIIRYRTDLNNRMRIVYDTQVYEILSITDAAEGRNRFMRITSNLMDNIYFT